MNRNSKYADYGETMLDLFGLTRQSYIGKEKEPENNLGDHTSTKLSDHGVRKYDYETEEKQGYYLERTHYNGQQID